MVKERVTKRHAGELQPRSKQHPWRVFISFSHKEPKLAEKLSDYLESLGLRPMWSPKLAPGQPFTIQIKEEIARSHVLIPILTRNSLDSQWVHQEIGFATALNIPVIQLAVKDLPVGMSHEIQAVSVSQPMDDLPRLLNLRTIERAIVHAANRAKPLFESAQFHDDRTRMLQSAALELLNSQGPCMIRQEAALSSFSLPNVRQDNPIWESIEGAEDRSPAVRRDLSHERRLLEQHARGAGCRLIIDPRIDFSKRGHQAKCQRIRILIEFLESWSGDDRLKVVWRDSSWAGNLLMIGDWFLAESITPMPGHGYVQTLGTWHAPTILQRIHEFDDEFERLERKLGSSDHRHAAKFLKRYLEQNEKADSSQA